MRGGIRARDDVLDVAAEAERVQPIDVLLSRRGRIVRGEEEVPARFPKALERLARVREHEHAAVEHAVHVEDRDRHGYLLQRRGPTT